MHYQKAIVFGASGGIGSEVVARLNGLGFELLLIDLNQQATTDLAASCHKAEVRIVDFCDVESVKVLLEELEQGLAAVDVAFVNAGMILPGDLASLSSVQVEKQLTVNLMTPALLIQACAKAMQANKRGHIVTTVSMGGIVALKGSAAYSASKFGLRGLLTGLKYELAPHGVAVSGIYPSGVDTPMLHYEATHNGTPLTFVSKPITPADVADAFVKTLKTRKLEVYTTYGDSLSGRFVASFPWLMRYLYPLLEKLGERGRKAYLVKPKNQNWGG